MPISPCCGAGQGWAHEQGSVLQWLNNIHEQYFSVWRVSAQPAEYSGDGCTPVLLMNGILPQLPIKLLPCSYRMTQQLLLSEPEWICTFETRSYLKCILFLGAVCMSKLLSWQHQVSCREGSKWDEAQWSNPKQILSQIAPVIFLICSSHILTSRAAEAPGFPLVSCQPALINLFRTSWFSPSCVNSLLSADLTSQPDKP